MFNPYPYHARPMARNLITNALYRSLAAEVGQEAGTITATFHPIVGERTVS